MEKFGCSAIPLGLLTARGTDFGMLRGIDCATPLMRLYFQQKSRGRAIHETTA
jgi:hypothetical protein